jgi:hypothetical protein
MGRYTVEITADSGARTVVCVDVSGQVRRITAVAAPPAPVGDATHPTIDLAMLARALGPAGRESASRSEPRKALGSTKPGRRRRRAPDSVPTVPASRRPASP